MKKSLYIFIGCLFSIKAFAIEEDPFGVGKIGDSLQNGGNDLVMTINNIAGYIISLFYFISVMIAIYGGFKILTSLGDDENVKKGKNIIIYAVIGLIVIFLASQLVSWIIKIMTDEKIVGPIS